MFRTRSLARTTAAPRSRGRNASSVQAKMTGTEARMSGRPPVIGTTGRRGGVRVDASAGEAEVPRALEARRWGARGSRWHGEASDIEALEAPRQADGFDP